MKKVLSLALMLLVVFSTISLAGCSTEKSLNFGMGVYAYIEKASSADGETNGEGEVVVTAAAVLLDADGKIVKCVLDTADNTVAYTKDGKNVLVSEFKTKYELKESYGMKAYAGSAKEWYEQADAFATAVVGKTIDDVKKMVATDGKGSEEVVNAGCTIAVSDFVFAIEKAVKNAVASNANKNSTLKLGIVSTQTGLKDATEEANGVNEVDVTIVASALDADKKVVATASDALIAEFKFDTKGASTLTEKTVTTKLEAGANYGMAKYGTDLNGDGKVLEWNEQAKAFNEACIGKTSTEISALAINTGYGVDTLQTAGCTINVSDLVKAAVKAATVG